MSDEILSVVRDILSRVKRMEAFLNISTELTMSALDDLTAQVAANTAVEASALTLINGIAAQILANKDDPAKIEALVSQLNSSAASLSAAVIANTPVVAPPVVAPPAGTPTTPVVPPATP